MKGTPERKSRSSQRSIAHIPFFPFRSPSLSLCLPPFSFPPSCMQSEGKESLIEPKESLIEPELHWDQRAKLNVVIEGDVRRC
jgi:hypothetical protein